MNPKNFEIRKNTVLDFCCKELPKHIEGITTNSYNSNKIVEKVLKFLCSSFKRKKKGYRDSLLQEIGINDKHEVLYIKTINTYTVWIF